MGYNLYITRSDSSLESESNPITLEEWYQYVDADPEFRLDGFCEAHLESGSVLRLDDESIAVWTAYSEHMVKDNMAWFWWFEGSIVTKNPDPEIIKKMVSIAKNFSAQVLGEEDEIYDESGRERLLDSESSNTSERSKQDKPWWKFW